MSSTTAPEPRAPREAHRWHRPGGEVDDPYAWMRNRDDPRVVPYLEAENAYAAAWMDEHRALVDTVFAEIKSRVQENDFSPPARRGEWWYWSRTEEGGNYPIHCRGRHRDQRDEQVILDENSEAHGHDYFALAAFDLNHDQTMLAWSADVDGSEYYTLRFRDLSGGRDLDDVITDTTWAGTAWSACGEYVFYTTQDAQQRPYRVWRHRLGTTQADDVLVLEETDQRFFVHLDLSRSGDWILIDAASRCSSEGWIIPAGEPLAPLRSVRPRVDDVEYSVEHCGDVFVITTNLDGEDFAVMTAPVEDPSTWTPLLAHQPGRRIDEVEPFDDHLVVHEWSQGQPQLRIVRRDGTSSTLDLGDEPYDVEIDANPDYDTDVVRYSFQSLTTPLSVYERPVGGSAGGAGSGSGSGSGSGEAKLLKQTPVPGVDLSAYVSRREWASSADGTLVPVDIVHHRSVSGPAPTLLYGYGSYESSTPPWFSVARLSLLDRGMVFALAHPRGGGELGRQWYVRGKLDHKRNTFDDTLACAEHLQRVGVAAPGRLAVRGASAGGLLVGACVTMRPELFATAVAEVPFVDVVNTISDPTLPLTVNEWEEWGDPRSEPMYSYIAGYSPYDNTRPGPYPALYVTAGLNDPRVSFHEPAKWVAKLRSLRTNDAPLLLWCEMGAGHGGPSGRYDAWRDEARVLAFVLVTLGIEA